MVQLVVFVRFAVVEILEMPAQCVVVLKEWGTKSIDTLATQCETFEALWQRMYNNYFQELIREIHEIHDDSRGEECRGEVL